MSFILEALKKAEKNRQKSTAPTLETQHQSSVKAPTKRPLWIGLLVFVLLFNGVVLIWLFAPWQKNKHQTEKQPLAPDIQLNAKAIETPTALQPAAITPAQPILVQPTPVTRIETQPIATQTEPTTLGTAALTPAPAQPEQPRAVIAPPTVTTQPTTVSIRELPVHIQQQLPSFTMSVHGYAGDHTSLIRLNNKIMRQGSTLDGRYRLEEITADGAIFNYQGYRFLITPAGQ